MRPGECAFLNCQVVDDVHGFDLDMRIREGSEPAAEERGAGHLALAVLGKYLLDAHLSDFFPQPKLKGLVIRLAARLSCQLQVGLELAAQATFQHVLGNLRAHDLALQGQVSSLGYPIG